MERKDKWWLPREVAGGGVRAIAFYVFTHIVIPWGVPLMTGIAGWAQGVPWFYLIIGVTGSAALVFHALARFAEWQSRTKVKDKIGFRSVRVGSDMKGDGIIVGFDVDNLADFPIDFLVSDLMVRIGDRVPSKEHKPGDIITIPPRGMGWYNSPGIKIDNTPSPGILEGVISFKLNYGRDKILNYELSQKKFITLSFDESGRFKSGNFCDYKGA